MRTAVWIIANVAAIGAIFALLYERKTPVECLFTTEDSQPIVPGIQSGLSFKGTIEPPTKGDELDLRSVNGTLSWSDGRKSFAAEAIGSVFTDENGAVLGVHMFLMGPAKGFRDFSVATLNEDGWLDENRETAFVWRFPAEKQLHPASYNCDIAE